MKSKHGISFDQATVFFNSLDSIKEECRKDIKSQIHHNVSENSIWLYDCGGRFGSSYIDYAIYLSMLVLLYDRIYWYNPHRTLLIPDWFKKSSFRSKLAGFGITDAFPEFFSDLIRNDIVIPVGQPSNYIGSESHQEYKVNRLVLDHIIDSGFYFFDQIEGFVSFRDSLIQPLTEISTINKALLTKDCSKCDPELKRACYDKKIWAIKLSREILESLIYHNAVGATTVFSPNDYSNIIWNTVFNIENNPYKPDLINEFASIQLCNSFFERVALKAPQVMNFDELFEIQSNSQAKNMRLWLARAYKQASFQMPHLDPLDPIVDEFNILVQSDGIRRGRTLIDFTFSATMGGFGAVIGGIPGAIIGSGGAYVVKTPVTRYLVKHFSKNSWIITLAELREKNRIR